MHELAVTEGIVKVALKYAEQNDARHDAMSDERWPDHDAVGR